MRLIFTLMAVLMMFSATAIAAPPTAEEKAANAVGIYDSALDLTDEQARTLEEGLVRKFTVGKEAYALKKAGKEAEGKKMNQQAGKEFNQLLRATLSREQWAVYDSEKDDIRKSLQSKN